jgi:hypothetical protein
MELKLIATLFGERQADETATVDRHEANDLGRDEFSRTYKVALVLAVLVVDDYDHPAVPDLFYRFIYRG